MSHAIGRIVPVGTRIGPDSGAPVGSGGFWQFDFTPQPALMGGEPRFVILHFNAMSFPSPGFRLDVSLRYETEQFTAASGTDIWTRPIDPRGTPIRIRYYGSGTSGGVTLLEYGSGEPTTTGTPGTAAGSLTNTDPFLHTDPYVEPTYETRVRCGVFDWQNAAYADPGSPEELAAQAVGCLIVAHPHGTTVALSSCSGTLIAPNRFLTARHCVPNDLEVNSGSVVFGYQTTPTGGRPAGYTPRFYKVTRAIQRGAADWAIVEIATPSGGSGITPAQLRSTALVSGEEAIAIHHPNGAVKKMQRRSLSTASVDPAYNFDLAGGSSGSALFDTMGRVIGAAAAGAYDCTAHYVPTPTMLRELATAPAPATPYDVMVVIDRSGSMDDPGSLLGRTKMQEARDAASLFVRLVRRGVGHRLGLASFSTSATRPADSTLGPADAAKVTELVGPSPYSAGRIGGLAPGGMTSIGDGLQVAIESLTPAGTNQRAVLLMTDGLQNTPPMISTVEGALGSTQLHAVGFGAESNLNSTLLSRVARDHGGIYTRANDGLELRKYFALAFGNIFETGALSDPIVVLGDDATQTEATGFDVCEEDQITAIVGWEGPSQALEIVLRTPGGSELMSGSAGVEADSGETWQFLRVPLPHAGEREGRWSWWVRRVGRDGEFLHNRGPEAPDRISAASLHQSGGMRLFVTIVPSGGPTLRPLPLRGRLYTGDAINPTVELRYADGRTPHGEVRLEIETPAAAIGAVVSGAQLAKPEISDEPVSAFLATLRGLGNEAGYFLPTQRRQVDLYDDAEHEDGAMEPDGIFGNPLIDLTRYEGTYRFHAIARYGTSCTGTREAQWALHVALGIDSDETDVALTGTADRPDGSRTGVVVITPRDRFRSPLGPGRVEELSPSAGPGTTIGPPVDNGDGTYSIDVTWDRSRSEGPTLVISQPERPPRPLSMQPDRAMRTCPWWIYAAIALLATALLIALLVILILAL